MLVSSQFRNAKGRLAIKRNTLTLEAYYSRHFYFPRDYTKHHRFASTDSQADDDSPRRTTSACSRAVWRHLPPSHCTETYDHHLVDSGYALQIGCGGCGCGCGFIRGRGSRWRRRRLDSDFVAGTRVAAGLRRIRRRHAPFCIWQGGRRIP